MKLLMISGKSAAETALGKKNAFYNTLEELHTYFDRIDILAPVTAELFGNVFFHPNMNIVPDIMTVHEYAPFRNGRAANKIWEKTKIPMLFEIMHIPGVPRAGSWKEYTAKLMTRYYIARDIRHAKVVRVINSQVGRWLENAGVPAEKIKLIPAMYIDLDIFKPMNLKKKYDLIFIGRRATNKGISLFEKSVKKIGCTSIIVDGWAKDSHEVARLINESKLLVMPSYNEGGPRVVLEALACDIPVLATPVGIVPEVVPRDWIIDWSVDDITQKARRILAQGPWRDLRGVTEPFEKKTAIKNYAEVIKSVA